MKSENQIPKTVKFPRGWRLFWVVLICCADTISGASYPSVYRNNEAACITDNSGKYARHKHEYLLANYPDYGAANVDIEAFIDHHGEDVYLAAAILYEAFMDELGKVPDDPYLWQLAMEVFQEELFPILLEFTPGVGDLIGAYNDFQAGSYFWGIVGIVGAIVPGDEVIKVIRKADNIRDAWRKVKKVFTLWNRLFSTAGGSGSFVKCRRVGRGCRGRSWHTDKGYIGRKRVIIT